jgi:TolA-binding protein
MNRNTVGIASLWRVCGAVALVFACALPAQAQTNVGSTDIQRLQDQVYEASGDIARLRSSNTDVASRLQTELDELRDEVVYLKVKMRKEGSVNRSDYADVRDRLQDLRSRARGDGRSSDNSAGRTGDNTGWRTNSDYGTGTRGGVSGGTTGSAAGGTTADDRTRDNRTGDRSRDDRSRTDQGAIPSGQEIDVRLETELSSDTAQVEQRFEATTVADLFRGNEVLVPAGSSLRGVVSSVQKATRMDRKGSLKVSFDQITVRGRNYPIRGTVTQALESEGIRGEAGKIGTGGAVGAIIGGIMGGLKGAVLGAVIGGGGIVAATEGSDVKLPAGTILRVQLDTPPNIR